MPTFLNRPSAINYLNVVAFVINLAANFAPAPHTMNELSAKYQTLITPAGYAFSIWGLIFFAEAALCVAQFLPAFRGDDSRPLVGTIKYNFIVANLAQAGWVFAFMWYEQIGLSLFCMVVIFVSLARIIYNQYQLSADDDDVSIADYWLFKFPVTIHFGWIAVATLLNMNVVLVSQGATAEAQYLVACMCLATIPIVAVGLLFFATTSNHHDVGYVVSVVFCWATYAIYGELGDAKDLIASTFSDEQIQIVRSSALTCCIITAVALVASLIKDYVTLKNKANREQQPAAETASLAENDYSLHTEENNS